MFIAWAAFVAISIFDLLYFLLVKRRFDFLTIAFVGGVFYFSPLFVGYVIQSGPYDPAIPEQVYWIGTGYLLTILVGALIADRFDQEMRPGDTKPHPMSWWYVGIAVAGLVGELVRSHGALINPDKLVVLNEISYLFATFEIASGLALLSAIIERRLYAGLIAGLLIVIDVMIGFRFYAVLTALAIPVAVFLHEPRPRFIPEKILTGVGAAVFVVVILMAHTARLALFNTFGHYQITAMQQMRSDTIQYSQAMETAQAQASSRPAQSAPPPIEFHVPAWAKAPVRMFMNSEQFLTQGVLVETVHQQYACTASNILKSLYLVLPPGFGRLLPNPYPPTFYDEYQPVLYPGLNYGLGGNVWAEMLCRFGYFGDAAFAVILITLLIVLNYAIRLAPEYAVAPLTLGGVVLAFYFNRNDVNYELVMLRQITFVFIMALAASWVVGSSKAATLGG